MSVFEYVRATDVAAAIEVVSGDPAAAYLAGGTTELDLLLKDRVIDAGLLVDIADLPLRGITTTEDAVVVGALTSMEELAADATVTARLPFVREALLLGASVQLRNMATIGGNLLQRTRCRYFRDPTVFACNKRRPGSGCAARDGVARMHAVLGTSDHCIALHASDVAVPLIALDTVVHVRGPQGARTVPLSELYLTPGDTPDREHTLAHGDLITAVEIPLLPPATRSTYLKVRDRVSYELALTSAAVALQTGAGRIIAARIALGGVGTIPWRCHQAEQVLVGAEPGPASYRAAAEVALAGAITVPGTSFKVELARRTLRRALAETGGAPA